MVQVIRSCNEVKCDVTSWFRQIGYVMSSSVMSLPGSGNEVKCDVTSEAR